MRESSASMAMCTNLGEGKRDRDAEWVRGREGGGGRRRGPPWRCARTWERGRGIRKRDRDAKWVRGREGGGEGDEGLHGRCA